MYEYRSIGVYEGMSIYKNSKHPQIGKSHKKRPRTAGLQMG